MDKPAKFGIWKYVSDGNGKAHWECSLCGKKIEHNPHDEHYCSNCGAKMSMEA